MSSKPPLLDTNVLVYAFTDDTRAAVAQSILAEPFVLSVQVLNEFANVARRKLRLTWGETREAIEAASALSTAIIALDQTIHQRAMDLAERFNLAFYDALIVSAAIQAGCDRCLSEDVQHGMVIDGTLTIVNPFR